MKNVLNVVSRTHLHTPGTPQMLDLVSMVSVGFVTITNMLSRKDLYYRMLTYTFSINKIDETDILLGFVPLTI